MQFFNSLSPTLPLYVSLPLALFFLVAVLLQIRVQSSKAVRYVLFAVGFRLLLNAFYVVTFLKSPIGLSWNAVGTVLVFSIGVLVMRRRSLFNPGLAAVYPLAIVILLSGIANGDIKGMIEPLAKYGYFTVLILTMFDALEDVGPDRLFKALLLPLSLPFVFQIASVALGIAKAGESDGSASYIGGFDHEASFSIALGSGLLAICFLRKMHGGIKLALIGWCGIAILLANYRTSVIALLPLIGVTIMTGITQRFQPRQRALIATGMMIAIATVGVVGAWAGQDRYKDVSTLLAEGTGVIKPLNDFTADDRKMLSGRTYIWSQYVYAYQDGSPIQKLVGFGAQSWETQFKIYAHNTLVSTLYELGIFGVIAMLFLWGIMLARALTIREGPRLRIVAGHLSFILLAMATMPMWMMEGLIFYGLLCGYTLYSARKAPADSPARTVTDDGNRTLPLLA